MRIDCNLFEDGEDLLPIVVFYCKGEDCKHSCGGWSGDGWHEPCELDWYCKKEDECVEKYKGVIAEWTDNPAEMLCPDFEFITDEEKEMRGW
jgi:hypothetical protein